VFTWKIFADDPRWAHAAGISAWYCQAWRESKWRMPWAHGSMSDCPCITRNNVPVSNGKLFGYKSHIRGWCWIIAEAQLMDYVASRLNPAWLTVFNIQEPLLPWVSGCILLTHCDLLPMQTTEWSQKQRLRWLMQLFSWALYNLALLSALHPCGHKGWTHNQVSCCHAFEPCEPLLLRCASTWVYLECYVPTINFRRPLHTLHLTSTVRRIWRCFAIAMLQWHTQRRSFSKTVLRRVCQWTCWILLTGLGFAFGEGQIGARV